MHRESSIEKRAKAALERHGWVVLKVGHTGYPDRIAVRERQCVWLEFKTPTGRLTAAQKRRIPKLEASHHCVAIVDDAAELERALDCHYYPFNSF